MIFKVDNKSSREDVISYIGSLKEGKKYIIDVKQEREKRSVSANSLYWMWVALLCNETGNVFNKEEKEKNVFHIHLKKQLLGYEIIDVFGIEERVLRSTAKMPSDKFAEYMERVKSYSFDEWGIILPEPKDRFYNEFINSLSYAT